MLPLFAEHEQRGDEHRDQVAPVDLLTVFDGHDALVGDPDVGGFRIEDEILLVNGLYRAARAVRDVGPRASHILDMGAEVALPGVREDGKGYKDDRGAEA